MENYGEAASRVGRATLREADGSAVDNVEFVDLWKRRDAEWRLHRNIRSSNAASES